MNRTNRFAPQARQEQLVIKELADETLIYDERGHKAHCLNQTAAFVWKHCDGHTSVAQLARLLEKHTKAAVSEQVVWFALRQLDQSQLLKESAPKPAPTSHMTRRALIRNLGIAAAITVPLVTSIVAPTATEAQTRTCAGNREPCDVLPCCPGFNCDGICFPD
jgi:Coenzyme PQQ synthesis protein D (PqqD)